MSSGRNIYVYSSVWELALLATDFEGILLSASNGRATYTFLHDVLWCNGLAPSVPRSKRLRFANRPPEEFGSRLLSESRATLETRILLLGALEKSQERPAGWL